MESPGRFLVQDDTTQLK